MQSLELIEAQLFPIAFVVGHHRLDPQTLFTMTSTFTSGAFSFEKNKTKQSNKVIKPKLNKFGCPEWNEMVWFQKGHTFISNENPDGSISKTNTNKCPRMAYNFNNTHNTFTFTKVMIFISVFSPTSNRPESVKIHLQFSLPKLPTPDLILRQYRNVVREH